jgi:hypothetical protein
MIAVKTPARAELSAALMGVGACAAVPAKSTRKRSAVFVTVTLIWYHRSDTPSSSM